MAINFPSSPTTGDTFTADNKTWEFNGVSWDITVSTVSIASNSITQEKLASNLSAVTVTTTANRDTDIPSPFTGQLAVLTDTKKVQLWDGASWLNITMAPPETPTSLSAVASTTSVAISFTAGSANGSAITNYKYALSTDGGSTYGSFIALDPVDIATPITISGLSMNTTYHVKLKAVNDLGDSIASNAVSFTTLATFTGQSLLVAGGQSGTGQTANSGGGWGGGGGGSSYNASRTFSLGDSYTVVVGGAGTSTTMTGATTANTGSGQTAGSGGGNGGSGGGFGGGNGSAYSIVGSSTYYGGGGGGGIAFGGTPGGPGGAGGGGVGATDFSNGGWGQPNSGGGGGGSSGNNNSNGGGGSGVVILRYPNTYTITLGAGLTGSTTTVGGDKVTTITAGSGNVSWA